MSRSHLLLFLFLPGMVAAAQSASDRAARYGDPDVERPFIRLGVTLTVRYAADRTACEMLIEPIRSIFPNHETAKYTRPEVMTEIIDEVLPEADRGKLLFAAVTKAGCNDYEISDYENVKIARFRHRCLLPNPEIEGAARITRKSPSCGATKVILPPS
jgi:hypothetical protein